MSERDPVQTMADGSEDLYGIAAWERRTRLDGLATAVYWLLTRGTKAAVVVAALGILVAAGSLSALTDPAVGALTALSALPALGLAAYVRYSDATTPQPLAPLAATFLLSVLTANFAAVVNSALRPAFAPLGVLGMAAFFFLVVGPVEETVKLLAVRLYAYTRSAFDSVVDGAVYGAVAGLGFATIENALFIARGVGDLGLGAGVAALLGAGGGITAVRALAGPGHVIYSAIAGYYLGLAKFNPDERGPIVVKGLLLAAAVHATYNTTVGPGSALLAAALGGSSLLGFVAYVLVFDTLWGLLLLRKIRRYGATYRRLRSSADGEPTPGVASPPSDD